jgi:ABC-type lipopolysaccharide export system ATPase subunit
MSATPKRRSNAKQKPTSLEEVILKEVQSLSGTDQRRVLEFARALASSKPKGVPGKEWARFANLFPPEDIKQIRDILETDCGRVDKKGR